MRLILPTENKNVARMQRSEIRESNNTNIAQISALFSSLTLRLIACLLSIAIISASPLLEAAGKRKSDKIALLEFRDISVGDALRILSDQSGLNVIASEQASKIKMTMYLHDIAPMEVVDAIARTYNLWYKQDRGSNVIRIYTVKEYRMEQVEFKQEHTEIFTLKNAKNALDLADTIQNLYGYDRVQLSFGENQFELMTDLSTRFALFDMVDRRTSEFGSSGSGGSGSRSGGGGSRGGGSGSMGGSMSGGRSGNNRFSGRSNNRSRTNGRQTGEDDSLDPINSTIADLRKQNNNLQNILAGEAGQSDEMLNRALVHQAPIYVSVIKRQNRVLVRTRDQEAMDDIRELYHQLDAESSMLLMEVKILSIDLSDGYDSLFDFKIKSGDAAITGGVDATKNVLQSLAGVAANTANPALLATLVSDKFEARLQLLEKENRVTEVATPVLMTTNQEVSRVFIGEERPIVNGYEASVASAASANTLGNVIVNSFVVPQTELRNIGTTLLLTPNINADRTVSIRVLIEQSVLGPTPATIPVAVGNGLVDANIDIVQSKTFSGTVVAKDGTAIAVGGLIEESAKDGESKVPILGDIPGLGFFFKDQSDLRSRKELVVIIRPYITSTPTEAAQVSKQFMSDNSLHPQATDAGNLDIYSNSEREHKDYVLEKPYKEYRYQDAQDRYRWNSPEQERAREQKRQGKADRRQNAAQQTYVELTKYAAKSVRLPAPEREQVPNIHATDLPRKNDVALLKKDEGKLRTIPVASWKKGGVHVTALEVHNISDAPIKVNHRKLYGRWLASTIEDQTLAPDGQFGDSTYLYLVSSQPFWDIMDKVEQ